MNAIIENARDEVSSDLSSQWLELSDHVRQLGTKLVLQAVKTPIGNEVQELVSATDKLCDHLDQLHRDVRDLLTQIDQDAAVANGEATAKDPAEILQQAIQIQRESHEPSSSLKDVIKALFMWRDDPADRLREKL